MSPRPPAAMVAVAQLRQLIDADGTTRQVAEVARQRLEGIEASCSYLEDRNHSIAFIGQIGVGKSSMIGVLADLIVGDPPTDRPSLKDNSVLAVGSGGTTVCEVRIVRIPDSRKEQIGMAIEPFSVEEMRVEISDFAHHEWARRREDMDLDGTAEDREPTPRG